MEKINKIVSRYTVLTTENVDTDQIIPAVHLKSIDRWNFGRHLFSNWRQDGKLREEDWPPTGSLHKILLAGTNFGCGSSREHAVWALYDYGFRAILSVKIADIFTLNALNNGLLPIEIDQESFDYLLKNKEEIIIDLEEQKVLIPSLSREIPFEISSFKKTCLINGFDTIDYLLSTQAEIAKYEQAKNRELHLGGAYF
jgi:3-isopropylmalate/(R)-2-methylmalate dehydratase small subunit